MAEGNFNANSYKVHNNSNYKKDFQNTEYADNISKMAKPLQERGDNNEHNADG